MNPRQGLDARVATPTQLTLQQTFDKNLDTFMYNPNKVIEYHALYIAFAQLPLNLGEDPRFEEYIHCVYNP